MSDGVPVTEMFWPLVAKSRTMTEPKSLVSAEKKNESSSPNTSKGISKIYGTRGMGGRGGGGEVNVMYSMQMEDQYGVVL